MADKADTRGVGTRGKVASRQAYDRVRWRKQQITADMPGYRVPIAHEQEIERLFEEEKFRKKFEKEESRKSRKKKKS